MQPSVSPDGNRTPSGGASSLTGARLHALCQGRASSACLSVLALLLFLVGCTPATGPSSPPSGSSNLPYTISTTTISEFRLPHPHSSLMRPGVGGDSAIYFGEMTGNRLGRLDPRTGQIAEWTPPQADYGIMGIVADTQNRIWFAEQNAGYIGEFFSTTGTFHIYPTTPRPDHGPSGPQDLAFDQQGNLWFTELSADRIGRLDVATGHLREYPVPGAGPNNYATPYGLAIDNQGVVWFSELSSATIGRLDPKTGAIQTFSAPTATAGIMEVAVATDGSIWFAEYEVGKLGHLDPKTGKIVEYPVPAIESGSPASGVYGLAVSTSGAVWFTDLGDNAIGQVQPATGQFTFYPIPTAESGPFGLVIDGAKRVWFTEGSDAGNAIGMLPEAGR